MLGYEERLMPMPPIGSISIEERIRFWSSYTRNGPDECWPWLKYIGRFRPTDPIGSGYGIIKLKRQVYKAHRVAYFLHHNQDPGKLLVRHTCDFTPCMNPSHLVLGTHAENMQDAYDRDRKFNHGSTAPGAKVDDTITEQIRAAFRRGEGHVSLAKRFGLHRSTIHRIVTYLTWYMQ